MQSLQTIYQTINQMETISQEQATVRPQHDYYPLPLAIAVFLFLYWLADRSGLLSRVNNALRQEASS
jgi:Ca-activated chloride channel family protein